MTPVSVTTLRFLDHDLIVQPGPTPETTLVAMKPMVTAMGLAWNGQLERIKRNQILAKEVRVIRIPSAGGLQDMTALPLTRINFWLATIQPDRVQDPGARDTILRYQEKCADVLFGYFFGKTTAVAPQIDVRDHEQLTTIALQLIEVNKELEARAERAEQLVEAARPKTTFYDQYASAEGLYTLQNTGRVLGQKPNKFIGWLKQGYLFYQGGTLVPKVAYREQGLFEVKATIVDDKARYQTFITPKGMQYFAKKLGIERPPFDEVA